MPDDEAAFAAVVFAELVLVELVLVELVFVELVFVELVFAEPDVLVEDGSEALVEVGALVGVVVVLRSDGDAYRRSNGYVIVPDTEW